MNLDSTKLSKISETKANTSWYHVHVKSEGKKSRTPRNRAEEGGHQGQEGMRNRERLVKGYRLSVTRLISLRI